MTVKWRTVIPLSSALIGFVLTFKIVTQLPTYSSNDDVDGTVQDVEEGRGLSMRHDLNDGKLIWVDIERRKKSLLLFPEVDDQDTDIMLVPIADIAQPDDNKDRQQQNVNETNHQQQQVLVDEKLESSNASMKKQHDDSRNLNDNKNGQLLMNEAVPNVADEPVDNTNSRQVVLRGSLLENVRIVGAIVQQLKLQSVSARRGVAGAEDGQSLAPVNPHPFRYIINCPQLCANVEQLFLVVYVLTVSGHYQRRTVIRQTWGDVSHYDVEIRVVFVTGAYGGRGSAARDAQTALSFEAERYQDIVQVS